MHTHQPVAIVIPHGPREGLVLDSGWTDGQPDSRGIPVKCLSDSEVVSFGADWVRPRPVVPTRELLRAQSSLTTGRTVAMFFEQDDNRSRYLIAVTLRNNQFSDLYHADNYVDAFHLFFRSLGR